MYAWNTRSPVILQALLQPLLLYAVEAYRKTSAIMSDATQGSATTAKLGEDKKIGGGEAQKEQQTQQPALLEEDDEFEDFPVEGQFPLLRPAVYALLTRCVADWTEEESKVPGGNAHLWEESWDDDDQNEDFSKQLRYTSPSVLTLQCMTADEDF